MKSPAAVKSTLCVGEIRVELSKRAPEKRLSLFGKRSTAESTPYGKSPRRACRQTQAGATWARVKFALTGQVMDDIDIENGDNSALRKVRSRIISII